MQSKAEKTCVRNYKSSDQELNLVTVFILSSHSYTLKYDVTTENLKHTHGIHSCCPNINFQRNLNTHKQIMLSPNATENIFRS